MKSTNMFTEHQPVVSITTCLVVVVVYKRSLGLDCTFGAWVTSPCNVSCGQGYQASTREIAEQPEGDTRCEGETYRLTECYQEEDCELGTLIPPSLLPHTFLFTVLLLLLFLLNLISIIFIAIR